MVHDFEATVTLKLKRDEAVVLQWFLTRELWEFEGRHLETSFADEAEPHCLEALLQELIPQLIDTGAPEAAGIEAEARKHLRERHC